MKLTCTAADLRSAAEWTAKIAPSNPNHPLLAGVLLKAADTVTLSATDYNTFGTATVPTAVVRDEGTVAVSARLLAKIAAVIPARSEVTLTADGAQLEVKAERARWMLPTLDHRDWLSFPDPGEPLGEIDGDELNRALDRVLPAVSTLDELPILLGVLVRFGDDLTLLATDKYRVARQIARWRPNGTFRGSVVAPGQMLRHAGSEGPVTIRQSDTVISLQQAHRTVMGRLFAEQFVKADAVLQAPIDNAATEVTVSVSALRSAVDESAVMLNDHAHLVLDFSAEGVAIRPQGDQLPGSSDAIADVISVDGEPITIGVKYAYLRDALKAMACETVRFTFTGRATAGFVIRPVINGEVDDSYRHIVMPLRLRERSAAA